MSTFDFKNYLYNNPLLKEEYKDVLQPKTMQTLSKQSAESLRDMLGGKSFMQAAGESMQYLGQLQQVEQPHKEILEELAKDVVRKEFPIIKQTGIKLEAQLVSPNDLDMNQDDSEEEDDLNNIEDKLGVDKRRLINAISQGASIRGTKSYYLFKDILDDLDPSLIEQYDKLVNAAYGIYDDDNAIAMMLAMMSQNQGSQGGESQAEWDEETETLTVRAKAVTFPILVHELIKGLYEIVSLQGFSGDAEKNKRIAQKADRVTNEPEDLRYGKFIYDALSNQALEGNLDRKLRELYFAEVYKLPDDKFLSFIENSINNELDVLQRKFVQTTIKDLTDEYE